ncbi:MAG: hypothetical protein V3R54_06770 [Thermodesulfovibrionia bacterium]
MRVAYEGTYGLEDRPFCRINGLIQAEGFILKQAVEKLFSFSINVMPAKAGIQ